jgi:hypothetical protein
VMHHQMRLFDYKRVTVDMWEMTADSLSAAAGIAIALFQQQSERESAGGRVTFHDIVKGRLGIEGESIPDSIAEIYAENLKAVRDERSGIRELIESAGIEVVFVDEYGQTAVRSGGRPATAFVLRSSDAGAADSGAQLRMAIGKVRRVVEREHRTGRISQPEHQRLCAAAADIESALAVPST